MISSPCKNCYRLYLPKDECLEKCDLLKNVQNLQLTKRGEKSHSSIDSSDLNRYRLALPVGSQLFD